MLLLNKLMAIQSMLNRRDTHDKEVQNETNPNNLLDRVLQEVHNLKSHSNGTTGDCKMEGQWVSDSAGGLFNLPGFENKESGQDVPLHRKRAHDRVHNGFMNFKDWNTSLTIPYGNSSQYIIINAWNHRDKLVATFMGECRVCRKKEVLQGNWAIVSHSRDCESEGSTAKLIGDVLRRDNIETLRKEHINKLKTKPAKMNKEKELNLSSENEEMEGTASSTKKNKTKKPGELHIKLH